MGLEIKMAKTIQGVFLILLCSISLCFSAPGGNPNCQVDGSEVPVCDGSTLFFSHQIDCGKFWECGPDLKPCLFECPPISEDIGGGILFFNIELTTCYWPQNVATTEASTDATTVVVTDATTEAVTNATTEAVTDATTEPVVDTTTDATSEAVTDATTEEIIDVTTDEVTDGTTEAVTDGPTTSQISWNGNCVVDDS